MQLTLEKWSNKEFCKSRDYVCVIPRCIIVVFDRTNCAVVRDVFKKKIVQHEEKKR